MEENISKNHRGVYKEDIYKIYAHWKFLPSQLRKQSNSVFEALGISDENLLSLAQIKTQKEFAEKYSVDEGTLTDWNKKLQTENSMQYIRPWSKFLDGSIVFAQYKKIMKKPMGNDVKNWFDLNENY